MNEHVQEEIHRGEKFMQRCIALALRGGKCTQNNPMVGAILVLDGKIIGEGYHKKYGLPHAEINAIESVSTHYRHLIADSTLYVSLEPCSHTGKTPPCAHKIVEHGIKNVVIGCQDPNPLVAGKGIKYLRDHGVHVVYPLLENECLHLIAKFKANLSGIPYVILKWAQSADYFISEKDKQTWLSNEYTRILTHKWRSEADAIMAGKNTVLMDNPALDVRFYPGDHPVRIIMDSLPELTADKKVFNDGGHMTYVVNTNKAYNEGNVSYIRVKDTRDIMSVMHILFERGIYEVIIEGGALLISSFIDLGLWHEARVIQTKSLLGKGVPAPAVQGALIKKTYLANDIIWYIRNKK